MELIRGVDVYDINTDQVLPGYTYEHHFTSMGQVKRNIRRIPL